MVVSNGGDGAGKGAYGGDERRILVIVANVVSDGRREVVCHWYGCVELVCDGQ